MNAQFRSFHLLHKFPQDQAITSHTPEYINSYLVFVWSDIFNH